MTNIVETIARAIYEASGPEARAKAVVTALEAAGYAIVPTSPTPEMAKAGLYVADTGAVLGAWEAMINAGKAKA